MDVQRCPECGGRITTNYCDICMKKVPFRGVGARRSKDPWDSSSAHREEASHECVSFDYPGKKAKPKVNPIKTVSFPMKKAAETKKVNRGKAVAIAIAIMSVISFLFSVIDEVAEPAPEPEYNYEAYVIDKETPQITSAELYNDGEIRVAVDSAGLYYEDYALYFTVQNDSQQDIVVTTDYLSVNGYMLSSGLYAPAREGETSQAFLILDPDELQKANITQVASIEFCLLIYDAQDYTDIAATELITLETDIAEGYVQPVDDSGMLLYEGGGVRLVLRDMEMSSYGDCDFGVYLENLSDKTVAVSASAIYVNGQESSGFLWNTLRPDTRTVDSIYIYDLDISEASQLEEITLDLQVEFMEDWYVEETLNETITFTP